MSDALTEYYVEKMNEVFSGGLSLDQAVALTYILDNYRLYFSTECVSEYGSPDQTPVDLTLKVATEIVAQLRIEAQVEVGDSRGWKSLCDTRFLFIHDQPQFQALVEDLIERLLSHRYVDEVVNTL